MKTGYWEFSPLEPKWSGVEPRLPGSSGSPRGTAVRAPGEPAGCKCWHRLQNATEKLAKLLNERSIWAGVTLRPYAFTSSLTTLMKRKLQLAASVHALKV